MVQIQIIMELDNWERIRLRTTKLFRSNGFVKLNILQSPNRWRAEFLWHNRSKPIPYHSHFIYNQCDLYNGFNYIKRFCIFFYPRHILICKSHSVSESFNTYSTLSARGADHGATRRRSIKNCTGCIWYHVVCMGVTFIYTKEICLNA